MDMDNFVQENIPFSDAGHVFAIGSKQGSTSRLPESSKSLGRSFVSLEWKNSTLDECFYRAFCL